MRELKRLIRFGREPVAQIEAFFTRIAPPMDNGRRGLAKTPVLGIRAATNEDMGAVLWGAGSILPIPLRVAVVHPRFAFGLRRSLFWKCVAMCHQHLAPVCVNRISME